MSKICCTWELGGGLGHIASIAQIGNAFEVCGDDVSYVLKETESAGFSPRLSGRKIYKSPQWNSIDPKALPGPITNYAEILIHQGYYNEKILNKLIARWLSILAAAKPDLVLVDHAPTAILSSYILGIPCVSAGTSFTSPARTMPLPPFRYVADNNPLRIYDAEIKCLRVINTILKAYKVNPLNSLADLFKSLKLDFLTTFRELDVYSHRTGGNFTGPLFGTCAENPDEIRFRKDAKHQIYVYIKNERHKTKIILDAISSIDADFYIYIDNIGDKAADYAEKDNLNFFLKPLNLNHIFPHMDLVVCNAGHGVISESLLSGVPLLLLPLYMEQGMNSKQVEKLGAGKGIKINGSSGKFVGKNIANLLP